MYRQRWEELTPQVQRALTTAIALARATIRCRRSSPRSSAAPPTSFAHPDDVAEGLALAADPAAWTVIQERVDASGSALADQARAELIDPDDEAGVRTRAIAELRTWLTERLENGYWLARTRRIR